MTYGILCKGPGMDLYDPPPEGAQAPNGWTWYHDFGAKLLYATAERAERDAKVARRYNPEWKYLVVATE